MLIQVRFKDNLVPTAQGGWLMIPESLNTVYDLKKYIASEFNMHYSLEDLAISHHEFLFTDQVPLEQVWKIAKDLDIVLKHVSNPIPPVSPHPYSYPSYSQYIPGYSDYYHTHYAGYPNPYYPYSYSNLYTQTPTQIQPQLKNLDKDNIKQKKHIKQKSKEYTKMKKKLLKLLPKVFKKRMENIRNTRDSMDIEEETLPEIVDIPSSQSDDSSSYEQENYVESPEIDKLPTSEVKSSKSDESCAKLAERKSIQSDDSCSNLTEEEQVNQTLHEIEEEGNYAESREKLRNLPKRRSPDYNEPMYLPPTDNITRVSVNMKELKRNPRLAEFQGKHIKFDSNGNQTEVKDKRVSDLNILSPSEQFDAKKAKWKIRPIPRRNPKQLKEGPEKQKVKRFGEYEYDPETQIKEVYNFNHEDFVESCASSLKAGDEILFKTFELSEERLTPQLSSYKRGCVDWTDEKFVHILLLREFQDEEQQLLEQMEFIDDLVMEKYELTLEKYLLVDVKVKKINEQSG